MANACDERERIAGPQRSRANCPVRKDAEQTVKLGGETLRALRRLRRQFRYCHACIDFDDCPVRAEFHAAVDQALAELYEEWNLK